MSRPERERDWAERVVVAARSSVRGDVGATFRHDALLYDGVEGLVESTLPFVREGLADDEPVLVAMIEPHTDALRTALGTDADLVSFLDMEQVGRNPARIIPAWQDFLDQELPNAETVRGIGEPIWAGRSDAELDECHLHEALLNVAFDDGPAWQLICPYDVSGLPRQVVRRALRTHPAVVNHAARNTSRSYGGHEHGRASFGSALPKPPSDALTLPFAAGDLAAVRARSWAHGVTSGLADDRIDDLVLAVHELATNSVRHGDGGGQLRCWNSATACIVEVADDGVIQDPLAGRRLAEKTALRGRGLWIVNQLCDLVQVRSSSRGTTVRLHVWR